MEIVPIPVAGFVESRESYMSDKRFSRELSATIGRDPCCPDDFGGSHYHCAYCGCVCGMMGHWGHHDPRYYCTPMDQRPEYWEKFVTVKEDEGN